MAKGEGATWNLAMTKDQENQKPKTTKNPNPNAISCWDVACVQPHAAPCL